MPKKYEIEKVLHEIIRDLPEAATTAKAYKRGVITFDEALCDALRAAEKAGDAPRAFSIRSEIEYLEFMFRAA